MGQFAAADVEASLSAIMGEPFKVPAFAFHLNEMTGPDRGNILSKTGSRRTFLFHLREPAMQPYIIMKSLKENIVSNDVFERFYVTRQKKFAI